MKVFLDDVREPDQTWVWVKTYHDAVKLLVTGLVIQISLDHDLGQDSKDKTGYDVAC